VTSRSSVLRGKVAIVTGATAGIGPPTCFRLARLGAEVAVVGRDPERIGIALSRLESETGRSAMGVVADVRRESEVEQMVEQVFRRFGRIDVLVTSAGILRAREASTLQSLARTSTSAWDEILDTNLKGVFFCNRAVLPIMIRQRQGHIINLSSTSGRKAYAFDAAYCASKFGVIGLTEAVAEEVRGFGVKVEVLLPGAVDTSMWEQNGPFSRPERALAPERVADCIVALLSAPGDTCLSGVAIAPFGGPAAEGWRERRPKPQGVRNMENGVSR